MSGGWSVFPWYWSCMEQKATFLLLVNLCANYLLAFSLIFGPIQKFCFREYLKHTWDQVNFDLSDTNSTWKWPDTTNLKCLLGCIRVWLYFGSNLISLESNSSQPTWSNSQPLPTHKWDPCIWRFSLTRENLKLIQWYWSKETNHECARRWLESWLWWPCKVAGIM